MADGQVQRKCGICRREPRGDDEAMGHPVRVTEADLKEAQLKIHNSTDVCVEEGLYQCCESCQEKLLPIVDARLRVLMIPEPLHPKIAKKLGRDYEMVPLIPEGGSISHHDRM